MFWNSSECKFFGCGWDDLPDTGWGIFGRKRQHSGCGDIGGLQLCPFIQQCDVWFERRQRECERDGGNGMQLDRQQQSELVDDYFGRQWQRQWDHQLLGCGQSWQRATHRHDHRAGPDVDRHPGGIAV